MFHTNMKKSELYNSNILARPGETSLSHLNYYICYAKCNKLVIMDISQLLCIISSPIGKSDEKRKFYQIFWLFCIIFMLKGEFEYQIDYSSQ